MKKFLIGADTFYIVGLVEDLPKYLERDACAAYAVKESLHKVNCYKHTSTPYSWVLIEDLSFKTSAEALHYLLNMHAEQEFRTLNDVEGMLTHSYRFLKIDI
jgi:hypothetical protein